jgi:hypothetical protein
MAPKDHALLLTRTDYVHAAGAPPNALQETQQVRRAAGDTR